MISNSTCASCRRIPVSTASPWSNLPRFCGVFVFRLLLHCPLVLRCPSLWVWFVIPVPVVSGSWRVKIVASLHQGHMFVPEKNIVPLRMGRRCFTAEQKAWRASKAEPSLHRRTADHAVSVRIFVSPRICDHVHFTWRLYRRFTCDVPVPATQAQLGPRIAPHHSVGVVGVTGADGREAPETTGWNHLLKNETSVGNVARAMP